MKKHVALWRAYRYMWWNLRIWACDVGSRIFGHGVDWCRIHGQWTDTEPEPERLERFFWQKP